MSLPLAYVLVQTATAREAGSALPWAPVVPHEARTPLSTRVRGRLAAVRGPRSTVRVTPVAAPSAG